MTPSFWSGLWVLVSRGAAWLFFGLLLLPGALVLSPTGPVWAGPVAWQELAASAEGRQPRERYEGFTQHKNLIFS